MKKLDLSTLPIFADYGNNLVCPNCGNGFLHHRAACITHRAEDEKTGRAVVIQGISDLGNDIPFALRVQDEANMAFNPSPRRGGILIEFDCECCNARPQLGIYQHKGCTVVEWFDIDFPEPEPKPQRKPIKPSIRFQILKRDKYRCQMCGFTAKDGATLEIDHILPVSRGGSNDASNLQVLCRDCNAGKSNNLQ